MYVLSNKYCDAYRFGFNGFEKDDEWDNVTGSKLDFGARIYDSRLGKWLSPDPYNQFVGSQYSAFANNPIRFVDIDGGWVPGVSRNGKYITLTAEKGDNYESLISFFGGKENAKLYIGETRLEKIKAYNIAEGQIYRIDVGGKFERALQDATKHPEKFYDTNKDAKTGDDVPTTYNCHKAAIEGAKGNDFVDSGNMTLEERDASLGDEINPDDAVVGKTVLTFGKQHSAVYFGTSNDGTVYVFSKNGDKNSPTISPIINVVSGGGNVAKPYGYGPVRENTSTNDSYVKPKDINKNGTKKGSEQKGYYNVK